MCGKTRIEIEAVTTLNVVAYSREHRLIGVRALRRFTFAHEHLSGDLARKGAQTDQTVGGQFCLIVEMFLVGRVSQVMGMIVSRCKKLGGQVMAHLVGKRYSDRGWMMRRLYVNQRSPRWTNFPGI